MKKKKSKFEKEIKEEEFRVTIFGSARIKKGDDSYKQVNILAKILGEYGVDIVTGGGPGLMQAASLGHKVGRKRYIAKSKKDGKKRKPAHTIGLGIKLPWEQKFNKGVSVSKEFRRFSKRLDNFMLLSNVVIVAPGGVGTLLELFYTWQLVQVKQICNIPIILLGDMWDGLIDWLEEKPLKRKLFDKKDLHSLFYAKDAKEAIKMIEEAHKEYKKGSKNYCLNYKRHKLY